MQTEKTYLLWCKENDLPDYKFLVSSKCVCGERGIIAYLQNQQVLEWVCETCFCDSVVDSGIIIDHPKHGRVSMKYFGTVEDMLNSGELNGVEV